MQRAPSLSRADALVSAFKRGRYDLLGLNPKQQEAMAILCDKTTTALAFGGGANGGKSWLGGDWLLLSAMAYPGTRWFIGREELKRLRESTFLTVGKVRKANGLPMSTYKYNGSDHYLQFPNGSRIDLLELKYLPSDQLYERYGSVEYTGGWIEEGGEVNFGAYDTLKSRVGRQLNDKYGLLGKILITCNPKKNWLYTEFYKPFKDKVLKPGLRFLQSLVGDNLKRESGAIALLESLTDKSKKERLLYGNWEYEDDPAILMEYDAITNLFTNAYVPATGKRYLTVDVARQGEDKTVIFAWVGWRGRLVKVFDKNTIPELVNEVRRLATLHQVPMSQVVLDEDGVGGGARDYLPGSKGFVNNSRPLKVNNEAQNYENLKTQCYYRLAELRVNKAAVYLEGLSPEQQELLTEELGQVKSKDADKDGKLRLVPKDKVKQLLGRSPDYADALMMREYFELASTYTGF
jgi:phage terminase large subunit